MSEAPAGEGAVAAAPPGAACFVCGAAASGSAKTLPVADAPEVTLRTCGECRARMRRARDSRDQALTEEGRGHAIWKAIDVAGAGLVLAGGAFLATWADWVDPRLVWAGWIYVIGVVPAGLIVYFLIRRNDAKRPALWEASPHKKVHDDLVVEVRGKLDQALAPHHPTTPLDDRTLIDPRTWSTSE